MALRVVGRYDWSEEITGDFGPSSFTTDLTGWSAGIALVLDLN